MTNTSYSFRLWHRRYYFLMPKFAKVWNNVGGSVQIYSKSGITVLTANPILSAAESLRTHGKAPRYREKSEELNLLLRSLD